MPEAAASLEPYMPTMSELAWMMDSEVSAALVTSPAICSSRSFRSAGALALKYSLKPSQRCLPVVEVESWQTMPTEPFLPFRSSIMCLAASSAAFLLFVWTVVTGMVDSTPESKATTGMPLSWISVSRSAAAFESRAAKPMAAGPESRADFSWSVCSVTLVSSCGPTKFTL